MQEGIAADDGFVGWDRHVRRLADETAAAVDFAGVDARFALQRVLTRFDAHDHFFERGIAGAFADAVQRHFDLACALVYSCEAVGHSEAEVVVAVNAEDCLVRIWRTIDDGFDEIAVFPWHRIADGVRQIDRRCAGVDDGFNDAAEERDLAAGSVLAGEFDVVGIGLGELDAFHRFFDDLIRRHLELVFHMDRASRDENMDARFLRALQRFAAGIDVLLGAARQTADRGFCDGFGDHLDGFKIARGGDWEACFDDIDAKLFELTGHRQFFL